MDRREGSGAPFGTGSRPTGRASKAVSPVPASIPSADGLWSEEAAIERAARAIAATKRGIWRNAPEIDRIWRTYIGQARAAVAAYNEPQSFSFTGVLPVVFP